jgi:putative hemolysin
LLTIVVIILVFSEITPRLMASSNPYGFLKFLKFPAYFTHLLFYPLGSLIHLSGKSFNKLWLRKKPEISMADLSNVIELSSEKTTENKKILESIVNYGSFDAVEIMKPRVDIVAFDISTPFDELLERIKNHNYSRIPIYTETYDNIKGILYVKDLLPHFHKKTFNWQTLIRPAYFVPESKKINDLLRDFQAKKIHMAIVTDEYGGTSGIVTLEDILEEIVGEITDELDFDDEISFKKIDDNNYIFDGKTPLNDFCKTLQLHDGFFDEITGDAETLAGILLEVHGELPKSGVAFNFKQFTFLIISSDKRRIKQIKITRNHLK